MEIDLRNLKAVINMTYYPLFWNHSRYLVLMGGAGSGKSVFAAQKILVRLITEPGHTICVLRKVFRTVRHSCFALFKQLISAWGWSEFFRANKTDMSLTFAPNGGRIISMGLDDVEKLKSIADITGFWIEEATEINQDDFEQVDLRLRGKTPSYKQIILSFNPISRLHWLKKRFFDSEQHGLTTTLRTTYRDNRFLDNEDVQKIELLKVQNPALHRVYGEGEWGVLEGLIYGPPIMDKWPEKFDDQFYGMDFGFNNPTVLIWCGSKDFNHATRMGDVYLREVIYQSGLTTPDIADLLRSNGVDPSAVIWADPAEPDRIRELSKHGFNVKPARRMESGGKGSVKAGIDFLSSLRLHSKPSNVNLNTEWETYSWQQKDGQYIDEPVKFADHAMDAMRYAIWSQLHKANAVIRIA